ncbi:hypothetical protein B0H63DRAFT_319911 [Podospora didyma]|uniref:Uncharacterized protein n=1 Tax=Podospora didyma TaxID=330526 RepID=A0AAE0K5Z6_9PEZI|nr:hypothetical protein B0H63DRAFT_319911 [Podospora didyma]
MAVGGGSRTQTHSRQLQGSGVERSQEQRPCHFPSLIAGIGLPLVTQHHLHAAMSLRPLQDAVTLDDTRIRLPSSHLQIMIIIGGVHPVDCVWQLQSSRGWDAVRSMSSVLAIGVGNVGRSCLPGVACCRLGQPWQERQAVCLWHDSLSVLDHETCQAPVSELYKPNHHRLNRSNGNPVFQTITTKPGRRWCGQPWKGYDS